MLLYRKQSLGIQEFSQLMQYFLAASSIDIIVGDISYDLLKVKKSKLLDNFIDHFQIVNKPVVSDTSCLYQENFDGRIFH